MADERLVEGQKSAALLVELPLPTLVEALALLVLGGMAVVNGLAACVPFRLCDVSKES